MGFEHFWDMWSLFNLHPEQGWATLASSVYWPALTAQLFKTTGLFLVVCFGSCM
jgi:hypothetical protein